MNMSDALNFQVTGTADLGDGLVLEVVTIPHVTVCQLQATVDLLLTPYATADLISRVMTNAITEAMVYHRTTAITVPGADITVTYNRDAAEWEIRGLPETEK